MGFPLSSLVQRAKLQSLLKGGFAKSLLRAIRQFNPLLYLQY